METAASATPTSAMLTSATPLVALPIADGTDAQEIVAEAEVEDQVGFKVALSFFPLFSLLKQSVYETCFQKLEHPYQNLKFAEYVKNKTKYSIIIIS